MLNKSILISAYAFYPEFGGLEQQIYLLAQEYLALGYSVDVLTEKTRPNLKTKERVDGITVYRMPYYRSRSILSYFFLIFWLSLFILQNRKKYSFIILRAALTLYPLIFGVWKCFGLLKTITWVTADTGGAHDEIILVKKWPMHQLMIMIFRMHDYLNSICTDNYNHYLELGLPINKLTRISNGIDISSFSSHSYPKKVRSFLFFGRLIKQKGIYELIKAFSQFNRLYPNAKLFIGGDGPERDTIIDFIKKNNLEKVIIYKGPINNKLKDQFYSLGECLVNPSYSEGFGLVYSEAAVRKKVIISTDVADLKKMYGKMIFFCKKSDPKNLFTVLQQVYTATGFPQLNYEPVIQTFDIKKTSRQILALSNVFVNS